MAMRWPAPIDNGPRNRCPSRCSRTFFRGAAGFHKLIMTFSRSGLSFLHEWFGIYVMYEGDFSPGNIILNMLMIRTNINAVMWSMKVECFATPLILFCAWLARSKDPRWLWPMIVILFALSFWGPYV